MFLSDLKLKAGKRLSRKNMNLLPSKILKNNKLYLISDSLEGTTSLMNSIPFNKRLFNSAFLSKNGYQSFKTGSKSLDNATLEYYIENIKNNQYVSKIATANAGILNGRNVFYCDFPEWENLYSEKISVNEFEKFSKMVLIKAFRELNNSDNNSTRPIVLPVVTPEVLLNGIKSFSETNKKSLFVFLRENYKDLPSELKKLLKHILVIGNSTVMLMDLDSEVTFTATNFLLLSKMSKEDSVDGDINEITVSPSLKSETEFSYHLTKTNYDHLDKGDEFRGSLKELLLLDFFKKASSLRYDATSKVIEGTLDSEALEWLIKEVSTKSYQVVKIPTKNLESYKVVNNVVSEKEAIAHENLSDIIITIKDFSVTSLKVLVAVDNENVEVEFSLSSFISVIETEISEKIYKLSNISKDTTLSSREKEILNNAMEDILELSIKNIMNNPEVSMSKKISVSINDAIKSSVKGLRSIADLRSERITRLAELEKKKLILKLDEEHYNAKIVDNTTGKTYVLGDLLTEVVDHDLKETSFDISALKNPNVKKSTAHAFRTAYQKVKAKQDLIKVLSHFRNDPTLPIYVQSIEINDKSDYQSKIDEVTVKFAIPGRKPQTLKFNLPKVSSDGFYYLNGSRKLTSNQLLPFPVSKISYGGEDNVRITTNYNRIFVMRERFRSTPFIDELQDLYTIMNKEGIKNPDLKIGNASLSNKEEVNSILFDEISERLVYINSRSTNRFVLFKTSEDFSEFYKAPYNSAELDSAIELAKDDSEDSSNSLLGIDNNRFTFNNKDSMISYYDKKTNKILPLMDSNGEQYTLEWYVKEALNAVIRNNKDLDKISPFKKFTTYNIGKKYIFTKIKVLGENLSLAFFLSYKIGFQELLDKIDLQYIFISDEDENVKKPDETFNGRIRFLDGNLYFNSSDMKKNLIVNGITMLDTKEYRFEEFVSQGKPFDDYFNAIGKPKAGKGLYNFYVSFVDPITEDVLQESNIPSDIVDLFIYCSNLLIDKSSIRKNDMHGYRMRNSEVINALTYKVIATSIERYRRLGSTNSTASFTIPPNAILKEVVLNPLTRRVAHA